MPTLVLAPGRCQGLGWPSCCGSCGTTCHGCHSSSPLVSPPRQALPSPPGRALPSPPSAPLLPRCLLPPATGQAKDCRTRRRTENGISKQQVRKHNWLRRAGNWKDDYNKNKKLPASMLMPWVEYVTTTGLLIPGWGLKLVTIKYQIINFFGGYYYQPQVFTGLGPSVYNM
ncbi:uncharacterized protein LOC120639528 isoform X2 [Panicum virgatum]|uniref:uncharacterized protein LOC120639528 isoform X2 n=1 Tax=Panicum virgatum TaxID=38727 RepID=UPI0019D53091|nr:uncharacterized protein LOC120639528 isoform X2 [Panicum virgatum]